MTADDSIGMQAATSGDMCEHPGPAPFPRGVGYLCTRPAGHRGAHAAAGTDGVVLDTWPQR